MKTAKIRAFRRAPSELSATGYPRHYTAAVIVNLPEGRRVLNEPLSRIVDRLGIIKRVIKRARRRVPKAYVCISCRL